jgi:hypothetical protein
MTPQTKLITALTTAAKKAPDKRKLKAKIKKIKAREAHFNWLSQ